MCIQHSSGHGDGLAFNAGKSIDKEVEFPAEVGVGRYGSKLGSRMFRSLMGDVESVNLVRECRELEEVLGTQYTVQI